MLNETLNLSIMAGNPKVMYLCLTACDCKPSIMDVGLAMLAGIALWEALKWAWRDKRTGKWIWEHRGA